jgi:hypothetical protein
MNSVHRISGMAVISLLVGLGLAAMVMVTLLAGMRLAGALHKKIDAGLTDRRSLLEIQTLLDRAGLYLDGHRFKLLPKVQPLGMVLFSDGSPNPVMSHPLFSPNPSSDAMTLMHLSLTEAWRVTDCRVTDQNEAFEACLAYAAQCSLEDVRSFLGVSVDGFYELVGKVSGSDSCRSFVLRAARSMSLPFTNAAPSCSIRLIVPILEHFTLYQDKTLELRYLAHAGDENLENQPLMHGVKTIQFAVTPLLHDSLYSVSASILLASGKEEKLYATPQLGRLPALNLLLNL